MPATQLEVHTSTIALRTMDKNSVQVLTADETGLIKVVDFAGKKVASRKFGLQSVGHGVTHMAWTGRDQTQVVAATQQGVIRTWNTASGTAVKQINFRAEVTDKTAISLKGLEVFNYNGAQRILTISENGQSYCFNPDSADFEVQDASSEGYVMSYSVGSDTRAFHVDPVSQSQFIVGGKENDVAVWDMTTQQKTFKCRNVPHDMLNLRQPVWVSALKYLDPSHTFVSGTAFHQVRLYDVRAQPRPVLDVEVGKYAVTSVLPVSAEYISSWEQMSQKKLKGLPNSPPALSAIGTPYIIVSDAFGTVSLRDIRKNLNVIGNYKGNAGSVRSISLHPTLPLFAAVGLDRHLRVYHAATQKLLKKVYLKQRQNVVLWHDCCDEIISEEAAAEQQAVWSHLDQNAEAVLSLKDAEQERSRLQMLHGAVEQSSSDEEDGNESDNLGEFDDSDSDAPAPKKGKQPASKPASKPASNGKPSNGKRPQSAKPSQQNKRVKK